MKKNNVGQIEMLEAKLKTISHSLEYEKTFDVECRRKALESLQIVGYHYNVPLNTRNIEMSINKACRVFALGEIGMIDAIPMMTSALKKFKNE